MTIIHDEFANLYELAAELDLLQQIDGILLDLGVSSPQLDDASRGFSFQHNGPLDMRMNPQQGQSAAEWLAQAEQDEIARVLWEYGEERQSRRIARKIVAYRQQHAIEDTATLARLISEALPRPKNNRHPATRSFQAIRIHINQELSAGPALSRQRVHRIIEDRRPPADYQFSFTRGPPGQALLQIRE